MLTCIACSKQLNTNNGGSKKREEDEEEEEEDRVIGTPRSKQAIKSLTSQVDNILPLCHFHKKENTKMRKRKETSRQDHFGLVGFCLDPKNKLISQFLCVLFGFCSFNEMRKSVLTSRSQILVHDFQIFIFSV